jgi:hypothetical protein
MSPPADCFYEVFKRLGSFDGPDDTILDVYQVDYDGTVRQLYLDGYRFSEPRAPLGSLCGTAKPLDPPHPDPMETRRQIASRHRSGQGH